ncbi:hypothetical protein PanWU01x14_070760, partial [Parasponia andersonii]
VCLVYFSFLGFRFSKGHKKVVGCGFFASFEGVLFFFFFFFKIVLLSILLILMKRIMLFIKKCGNSDFFVLLLYPYRSCILIKPSLEVLYYLWLLARLRRFNGLEAYFSCYI